jgi:SAM-dependent methyltransferase
LVLVTSRAYDEYVAMFDLGPRELSGRLLDCSAGAAEFAAVAGPGASQVVAVDPAYALPRAVLAETARTDLGRGHAIAAQFPDRFTWRWFGSPERRDVLRQRALARFVTDLVARPHRYVAAQLPQLPFRTASFDLALCSHLLFTWADQLGRGWHAAAMVELARVAAEVRVFPTVMQGAGEPVPFWDDLMADLRAAGLRAELRPVGYEFQVGADQMLVVGAAGRSPSA